MNALLFVRLFAELGYAAPLSAVARRAGVGQGSLHRHFPDRLALAVAVSDENIAELEALAAKPDATLGDVFDLVTEQAIVSTALINVITSDRHDPRVDRLGSRVSSLAASVLARDQNAGRVAEHVTADDVMLAISMLAGVLARSDAGERRALAQRARWMFDAASASETEERSAPAGDGFRPETY